jgi:hypothetical protein
MFMHNGVINNAGERRGVHEKDLGYIYLTDTGEVSSSLYAKNFNDSEAIAIDTVRNIEGLDTTIKSRGSCAFLCMAIDKKTAKPVRVYWGRNEGNELHVAKYKNAIAFASELEPGDLIDPFKLFSIELAKLTGTKKSVSKLINERDLAWEPLALVASTVLGRTTPKTYDWHEHARRESDGELPGMSNASRETPGFVAPQRDAVTTEEKAEAMGPSDDEGLSNRELAFEKMFERDADTVRNQLWPFFEELAYSDVAENTIDIILGNIKETLIARVKRAQKPRDWFDRQETEDAYRTRDMESWAEEVAGADDDGAPVSLETEKDVDNYLQAREEMDGGRRHMHF